MTLADLTTRAETLTQRFKLACTSACQYEDPRGRGITKRVYKQPLTIYRKKTHCKHGHDFTPENTGTTAAGHRFCRTCKKATQHLYYMTRVRPVTDRYRKGAATHPQETP